MWNLKYGGSSKKQDFWPRIKLGMSLENKVVQKLKIFRQFLTSKIHFGSTFLTLYDEPSFIDGIFLVFFLWVDSWPKILHYFRIHHLWRSTNELIIMCTYILLKAIFQSEKLVQPFHSIKKALFTMINKIKHTSILSSL